MPTLSWDIGIVQDFREAIIPMLDGVKTVEMNGKILRRRGKRNCSGKEKNWREKTPD